MVDRDLEQDIGAAFDAMDQTGPAPAGPEADDDLGALLRQFDEESASHAEPDGDDNRLDALFGDVDDEADIEATLNRYTDAASRMSGEGQEQRDSELATLYQWAANIDQERAQQRETADLQNIISMATNELSDLEGLPADFGERFLMSEYIKDAGFKSAWDSRYADDGAFQHAERTIQRKFRAMRKAATSQIDPHVSADKAMVTAAVRAGSQAGPPPRSAPNYGTMSDSEFADRIQKDFGFRPLS
jgi:hypothetical protein